MILVKDFNSSDVTSPKRAFNSLFDRLLGLLNSLSVGRLALVVMVVMVVVVVLNLGANWFRS